LQSGGSVEVGTSPAPGNLAEVSTIPVRALPILLGRLLL
jgi:hypothetical protein